MGEWVNSKKALPSPQRAIDHQFLVMTTDKLLVVCNYFCNKELPLERQLIWRGEQAHMGYNEVSHWMEIPLCGECEDGE